MGVKAAVRLWVAPSVLAVLTATSCASTTQQESRPDNYDSGPSPVDAMPSGGDVGKPSSATTTSLATAAAAAAAAGSAGSAATPGRASMASEPAAGSGGAIPIGIEILENLDQATAAFGVQGSSTGDNRAQAEAVIAHINENGGAAGRPLAGVYHAIDLNTGTYAGNARSTCATFTEDNHVLAAIPALVSSPGNELLACLAERGTPLIAHNRNVYDDVIFDQYDGLLYQPGRMSATRWAAVYIDRLVDRGFLAPTSRIGLLRFDQPVFQRLADGIVKPRLKVHGLQVAEEVVSTLPENTAGTGTIASEMANAVLRFRAARIDRVIFVSYNALLPFFFMPQAESQGYRPAYGLSSGDMPSWLAINVPVTQLSGAIAVGWVPTDDVALAQDPGDNPTKALCLELMRGAGQQFPDRISETTALGYCDALLYLDAVIDATGDISVGAIRVGTAALADSYRSPYTIRSVFAPQRRDAAAVVRDVVFVDDCACFVYEGPERPA